MLLVNSVVSRLKYVIHLLTLYAKTIYIKVKVLVLQVAIWAFLKLLKMESKFARSANLAARCVTHYNNV